MRAHDFRHKQSISDLVEEDDSVCPKQEAVPRSVAAVTQGAGRISPVSATNVWLGDPLLIHSVLLAWLPYSDSFSIFCADYAPGRTTSNNS